MTVRGSCLEVAYSQSVEEGSASLDGASPANVRGSVIPDLGEQVELAKRVDDWSSIACSPLNPLYHHVSHQTHYLSIEMPRDCTEALKNVVDEGESVASETKPPLLGS